VTIQAITILAAIREAFSDFVALGASGMTRGSVITIVATRTGVESVGLLLSVAAIDRPSRFPRRIEIGFRYRGTLSGRTVRGTVNRRTEGDQMRQKSLLATAADLNEVLMILTDDGSELKVTEKSKVQVRFYSLLPTAAVEAI
jgi:hypothetical protein